MKKIAFFIIMPFLAAGAIAQHNPLKQAFQLYQSGNLAEARTAIDMCMEDELLQKNPDMWYLKGFIMKDLYKNMPDADSVSFFRLESIEAFRHLIEMDTSEKYLTDALKIIRYLSTTFYNDAVDLIDSRDFDAAKEHFGLFKKTVVLSRDSTISLQEEEIGFLLSLGTGYMEEYKRNSEKGHEELEGAKIAYGKILEMYPRHMKANYNLGILYYNQAVNLINAMNYDKVDLIAISQLEDKAIELFRKSLPFMAMAYEMDPKDRNTLEGLAGIFYSLREYDKSDAFKSQLAALENDE